MPTLHPIDDYTPRHVRRNHRAMLLVGLGLFLLVAALLLLFGGW